MQSYNLDKLQIFNQKILGGGNTSSSSKNTNIGGEHAYWISAVFAALFGNLGDLWARAVFFNGAIRPKDQMGWTLYMPGIFNNIIAFAIFLANGKDPKNGKTIKNVDFSSSETALDLWALYLLFMPMIFMFSLKMSGVENAERSFVLVTFGLTLIMVLARIYRKTIACNKDKYKERGGKFSVSFATDEALTIMIIVNAAKLLVDVFNNKITGYQSAIPWYIQAIFYPYKIYYFIQLIFPGFIYGLLMSTIHLFLNSNLNSDSGYRDKFCKKQMLISPISWKPPYFSKKGSAWMVVIKFLIAVLFAFFGVFLKFYSNQDE